MKIAVEEWELYNNGILLCKWFDTEIDAIEDIENYIRKAKKENGLNYNEIEAFIADVEGDELNIIKGDENLSAAYEVQELRDTIQDYDLPKIDYLINCAGYDIEDVILKVDDCDYYENMTFSDLAEEFVNDGVFGEIPENLVNYLDYAAIARDLQYDYTEWNGSIFRCD